jgi:hypothetical protein
MLITSLPATTVLAMTSIEGLDAYITKNLSELPRYMLDDDFFAVCKRRNGLTPFCRLPDDVLIRIIQELQRLCIQSNIKPGYSWDWFPWSWPGPETGQWTRISRVCARVHQLIANARLLWRVYNLDVPPEAHARTSQYIPDLLNAYGKTFLHRRHQGTLEGVQSRIQNLSLVIEGQNTSGLVRQLVQSGQSLLHGMYRLESLELIGSVRGLDVPLIMDDSITSKLTSLKVSVLALADQVSFPQLKVLEWYFTPRRGDQLRLARLIGSAPNLERVNLGQTGLWFPTDMFSVDGFNEPIAHLASLSTLAVAGSGMIVDKIIRLFPNPSTHLRMHIGELPPHDLSLNMILNRALAFMASRDCGYTLLMTTISRARDKYEIKVGTAENVVVDGRGWPDYQDPVLTMTACSLSCIIHITDRLHLERITTEPTIAKALMSSLEWRECNTLLTVKHIEIMGADNILHYKGWRGHFMEWLYHRAQVGAPIDTLYIRGCAREAKAVKEIENSGLVKNIVTDVE